ncbi:MAG: hypothetical protein ACI9V8_000733 [Urechidicola sp.]|jgi:hypothetical protein
MAVISPVLGFILYRKGLWFILLFGLIAVFVSGVVIGIAERVWVPLIGFGIIATHAVASAVAAFITKR